MSRENDLPLLDTWCATTSTVSPVDGLLSLGEGSVCFVSVHSSSISAVSNPSRQLNVSISIMSMYRAAGI